MNKTCYIVIIILLLTYSLSSSEVIKDKQFNYIKENISKYKNREITMQLRLKYHDKIFDKIIFYNNFKNRNHDIEFDISSKKKQKSLKNAMINLHRGMLYNVKFIIKGVGALGGILGELIMFQPVILDKIP